MGNNTEFNLRTVPMLFGVKEAKVTRDWGADMGNSSNALVDIVRCCLICQSPLIDLCRKLSSS